VRSDGTTNLAAPRPASVLTRNLLMEVNDHQPAASSLTLLQPVCSGSAEVTAACEAAKTRLLTSEERRALSDRSALGCRNPVGLDHIWVTSTILTAALTQRNCYPC
jgi:hypothetical protein